MLKIPFEGMQYHTIRTRRIRSQTIRPQEWHFQSVILHDTAYFLGISAHAYVNILGSGFPGLIDGMAYQRLT